MRIHLFPALLLVACSGQGKQGGPADGGADTHCTLDDGGVTKTPTSTASCHPGGDAGSDMPDYGDTLYGNEGDDDDCKYHVKWTATGITNGGITNGGNATFACTVTRRIDGAPAKGAAVYTEVYLSSTHPAPKSGDPSTENPDGTYTINNVSFDASGRWTVRFHIFGECEDTRPDSPHGHAAFFVDVP
jgi:hypothetical protein